MKTIQEWLDMAKDKSGSDYATAKAIGVSRQAMSKIRNQQTMHNNTARKLAEFLDVNPLEIIASMEIERRPEEAIYWKRWVACFLILGMTYVGAEPSITGVYWQNTNFPVYTLCEVTLLSGFVFLLSEFLKTARKTWVVI